MKIQLTSVMVKDQAHALQFYTEVLGFVKKQDMPMGEYRWLTVISPQGHDDVELLLEPMGFPPAVDFQKALYDAGVPATGFSVGDIQAEYERLTGAGVTFKSPPAAMGPVTLAAFDDTCGNWIQLYQV
jgi:catechol 2,3-dioxygenase-like lactoylglutathione lyase family enzyme